MLRRIGSNALVASAGALLGGGAYVALHVFTPQPEGKQPSSVDGPYYAYCRDALLDGRSGIKRGEPGYRAELDADGDGIACEPFLRR